MDFNTTGVLILTNDGEFAQKLIHPRNNIIRQYEVKIDKELEAEHEIALLKGVFIDGTRGKFISIKYGKKKDKKNLTVECTEGRNHFVKKMFTTINYTVEKLHRSSFAGIVPDIPIGSYRKLTPDEINKLSK